MKMKKNSIYISIYQQDYIWHKIKPDYSVKQKETCKRLSIPKYIRKKFTHIIPFFLKNNNK